MPCSSVRLDRNPPAASPPAAESSTTAAARLDRSHPTFASIRRARSDLAAFERRATNSSTSMAHAGRAAGTSGSTASTGATGCAVSTSGVRANSGVCGNAWKSDSCGPPQIGQWIWVVGGISAFRVAMCTHCRDADETGERAPRRSPRGSSTRQRSTLMSTSAHAATCAEPCAQPDSRIMTSRRPQAHPARSFATPESCRMTPESCRIE